MAFRTLLILLPALSLLLLYSCGNSKKLVSDLTPKEEMQKAFKYCNYPRAISFAKRVYDKDKDRDALNVLAESYLYMGNTDSAEFYFNQFTIAGGTPDLNLQAKMHLQNRDYKKAANAYRKSGNEAGQLYCELIENKRLNCTKIDVSGEGGVGFKPTCYVFDASGSLDPNRPDLEFNWKFGDGKSKKGVEVEHCYLKPGKYEVSFEVYDPVSGKTEVPAYHDVEGGIRNPTTLEVSEGLQVYLPEGSHNKVGRAIKLKLNTTEDEHKYLWKMGDNTVYLGQNIIHTYNNSGSYNVRIYELNQQNEVVSCLGKEVVVSGELKWKDN